MLCVSRFVFVLIPGIYRKSQLHKGGDDDDKAPRAAAASADYDTSYDRAGAACYSTSGTSRNTGSWLQVQVLYE